MNQTTIDALNKVADIAQKLFELAHPLQEQFNPETYEVPGPTLNELGVALAELEDAAEDAILSDSGVLLRLVDSARQQEPSTDWRKELDEL